MSEAEGVVMYRFDDDEKERLMMIIILMNLMVMVVVMACQCWRVLFKRDHCCQGGCTM